MTITIALPPEAESRLNDKANRQGESASDVAADLLIQALEWDEQDYSEAVKAVRLADEAAANGKVRSLDEFITGQRAKHGFPPDFPANMDSE